MALEALIANLPNAVALSVSAGLVRNATGYLENALKDGKLDKYEVKQLLGTVAKYFGAILLLSLGMPVESATALTFGLDVAQSAVKKKK